MNRTFPIEKVRAAFPALRENDTKKPLIYFDGPGGTQMAGSAAEAMMSYISNGMANLHGTFPTSIRTDDTIAAARNAVADLLNCEPSEVAFGQNMTSLAFSIARSMAYLVQERDEIVVTELDHRANVDPWVTLAKDKGAVVKFIQLNTETLSLDLDALDNVITDRTKLVAVGMSSNVTGTVTDVERIKARAKAVGAILVVDAVHAVPHLPIDFKKSGIDILLCSAYKFFGPHLGIALISTSLFEKLPVYKLKPAPQEIPYKLETGTQNHEAIAGLIGAIEFIESLGEGTTRRERLLSGMQQITAYEDDLSESVEDFLKSLPEIQLYRAPEGTRKTPTFAFTIKGVNSRVATSWFAQNYYMCIADGDFYASTMAEKLGVYTMGGWIRIGLAPYNTAEEIELFKEGLQKFISEQRK